MLACLSIGPLQLLLFFRRQVTKSTTNPDELGPLANQLTNDYGQLAQEAKPAALTAENEEVRAWGGVMERAVEQSRVCWGMRAEVRDAQTSHRSWGQAAFTPPLQHGVETWSKAVFPFCHS